MDAPDALTSAAAGMRVQASRLDSIAQNLANASTIGYRTAELQVSNFSDGLHTELQTSAAQGALRRTDVKTDLALVGPGYFALATPDGVRYTRDGRMTLNAQRVLCDARGNAVLGSLGSIRLPRSARICEDGRVMIGAQKIDRIRIVHFNESLVSDNRGLLIGPRGETGVRSSARVIAGYLEDSGVDAITEMTALISTQRAFEANQKTAQRTDESLRRTVIDVPSVPA